MQDEYKTTVKVVISVFVGTVEKWIRCNCCVIPSSNVFVPFGDHVPSFYLLVTSLLLQGSVSRGTGGTGVHAADVQHL